MATDKLNPTQFGFLPFSKNIEEEIGGYGGEVWAASRKIQLNRPLRASQPSMDPAAVEFYKNNPRKVYPNPSNRDPWDEPPTIVRHRGENLVWTGHHRIAAARQRGQKTMRVNYWETGQ